jgi:hypothetical protein
MEFDEKLIEIREYMAEGYAPLIDYGAWRVAVLNAIDELLPQNIHAMQLHAETDEVFVLLSGRCILFLGEAGETVERIQAVDMQPLKAYNIKRGCWHTHTLNPQGSVLIVENRDTTDDNSPYAPLSAAQTEELVKLTHGIWNS